jgi:putative membrane protein insertion efficiency factor
MSNEMYVSHDHQKHAEDPPLKELPRTIWNIPRLILLSFIRLYQMTLSKTLPANTCRFYPSCSHYGYQAIYKYGVIKGGWLATWRVLRCNPFNRGGFDPVP